jgi:glycerate dehydrogenase
MNKSMKIVFLDKSTLGNISNLSELEKLGDVRCYNTTDYDETIERTKQADIIITNKVLIDQKVMDASPKLKLICIAATGMNNVDLEYAEKKGIQVRNVSGYSTFSVAQFTFSMILSLQNHISYYDNYVKSGKYQKSPIFTHHGREFNELKDKTLGIIGMGTIGQSVAKIAEAFGCRVIYYSTSGKNTNQPYTNVSLESLLKESDIVSIHAPLNEATLNLINLNRLKHMKSDAILINVGRGNIVNEEDLAFALDHNIIGGAGLDVFSNEPMQTDNPLLMIKNKEKLLLTPHIAWASLEARELLMERVCQNIVSVFKDNTD